MICIYSDRVGLTKEQIEVVMMACEGMQRIADTLADAIRALLQTLEQSPLFHDLLTFAKGMAYFPNTNKNHPKRSFTRPRSVVVKDQFMDRRPRMIVIRNNC